MDIFMSLLKKIIVLIIVFCMFHVLLRDEDNDRPHNDKSKDEEEDEH